MSRARSFVRALRAAYVLATEASRPVTAAVVGLQAVQAVSAAVLVLALREAVRHLAGGVLEPLPLVLAAAALGVSLVVGGAYGEFQLFLADTVQARVQARVATGAAFAPLELLDDPAYHARLERLHADAAFRPFELVGGAIGFGAALAWSLGALVAVALLQPLLLPVLALGAVPLLAASVLGSRAFFRFVIQQTDPDRDRRYLFGLLTMRQPAAELRALGLGPYLTGRFDDLRRDRRAASVHLLRRRLTLLSAAVLVVAVVGVGAVALVLGASPGRAPGAATATALAVAVVLLVQRLRDLSQSAGSILQAGIFLEDLALLDANVTPAVPAVRRPLPLERLALREVTFGYGAGADVLHGIDFEVRRGEMVAVVGENGAGKTTLARVLAGLYPPRSGAILWDGTDVRDLDPASLRQSAAVVFQDFARFRFTAAENIGLGDVTALDDLDAVAAAARAAGAHDFISRLPSGYQALLGPELEGGAELSTGQWQRLAVARALFRDAPLLVLDEPAASLDPDAETALFEQVRAVAGDRATVLISHRLGTVRSADRIYVLDGGRVVEVGDHAQLMAAGGIYRRLFEAQAKPYRLPAS